MYADIVETHINDIHHDVVKGMNYLVKEDSDLDKLVTDLIYAYADAKDKSNNTEGWSDDMLLNNYNILSGYYNTSGYASLRAIVENSVNALIDKISEDAYESRYSVHPGVYATEQDIVSP